MSWCVHVLVACTAWCACLGARVRLRPARLRRTRPAHPSGWPRSPWPMPPLALPAQGVGEPKGGVGGLGNRDSSRGALARVSSVCLARPAGRVVRVGAACPACAACRALRAGTRRSPRELRVTRRLPQGRERGERLRRRGPAPAGLPPHLRRRPPPAPGRPFPPLAHSHPRPPPRPGLAGPPATSPTISCTIAGPRPSLETATRHQAPPRTCPAPRRLRPCCRRQGSPAGRGPRGRGRGRCRCRSSSRPAGRRPRRGGGPAFGLVSSRRPRRPGAYGAFGPGGGRLGCCWRHRQCPRGPVNTLMARAIQPHEARAIQHRL